MTIFTARVPAPIVRDVEPGDDGRDPKPHQMNQIWKVSTSSGARKSAGCDTSLGDQHPPVFRRDPGTGINVILK